MPCDFYPQILFCGEKQDIQILNDVFTYFLKSSNDLKLDLIKQLQLQDFSLTLKYIGQFAEEGIFHSKDNCHFDWYLTSEQIAGYQEQLDELIHSKQKSGSVNFELLKPNEIKIKISMGEFDDSYLLNE